VRFTSTVAAVPAALGFIEVKLCPHSERYSAAVEYAKLGKRHEDKFVFVSTLWKAFVFGLLVFVFPHCRRSDLES
jgi:hypothetical protein